MGIKVRFDGLDVMAMVSHLQHTALGRRVINIYEGDTSDSFLFKLDHNSAAATVAIANDEESQDKAKEKLLLYLESGIRFHTTTRMSNSTSSAAGAGNKQLAPFVFQLRKQLRGLRLEQVAQLGQGDRVVHFVFGMGAQRRALLLELYAKGNLVLCDAQYKILALLRSHQYANEQVQVQVGHVYPVTYAARNVVVHPGSNNGEDETKKEDDENNEETTENDQTNANSEKLSVTASSTPSEWTAWAQQQIQQVADKAAATPENSNTNANNNKKKSKKDKQAHHLTWKTLLLKPTCGISHYGPNFVEHCILLANMNPHAALTTLQNGNSVLPDEAQFDTLLHVLEQESAKLSQHHPSANKARPPKGYILYSEKSKNENNGKNADNHNNNNNTDSFANKILEEFQPYLLLKQHEGRPVLEFDTFGEAVDVFYSHLEAQKRLLKAEAAEVNAKARLTKIKQDQELRLQGLERDLLKVQTQAEVVALNADNVDKALQVINSALDSGMDWEQLEQLVQVEQEENHNPIALLIYALELEHDALVLELPTAEASGDESEEEVEEVEAEDEEEPTSKKQKKKKNKQANKQKQGNSNASTTKKRVKKNHVLVTVSLKDSAHGNASQLFAKYRAMKEKSQRTVEASTKALKAAEENAQRQLAEAQQRTAQATNTAVGQIVKPPWFTKFHWFITSDNYLVIGGRDAHQNEVLVKKYLRPGDAYLHADVHGAASCILRAKRIRVPAHTVKGKKPANGATTVTQTLPLSDQALREAGNFTICRSSAWSSKMVTSAWWVESHQVSKTAPTGEYLKVGAFMIRGKKNFLPPTPLEMGLGVMFRLAAPEGNLDPATWARHKNERRDFALMEILQRHEDDEFDDVIGEALDDEVATKSDPKVAKNRGNGCTNDPLEFDDDAEKFEKLKDAAPPPAPKKRENGGSSQKDASEKAKALADSTTNLSDDQGDAPASPKPSPDKKKKKGLSVKERKLIKKYGSLEEADRVLAEREKEEQEREKEKQLLAQQAEGDDDDEDDDDPFDGTNNAGTMKRGKRGKKKKLMKKYADQDDEDRELAMLALQGGEKVKKSKDKRNIGPTTEEQKQAAAETAALLVKDASVFAEKLPEDIRNLLAECVTVQNKDDNKAAVRWEKFDADVLDQLMSFEGPHEAKLAAAKRLLFLKSTTRVDNFSASLAGILRTIRKYGHENMETEPQTAAEGAKRKTKEEKQAEDAEWKETLAEEGVADEGGDDDDMDLDDTAENNKLTGKPHPEDAILYALPVCAPYQTLSQYTYRIKLTPGNMKRGKAAKQCVDMFLKGDAGNAGKKSPASSSSDDVCKDLIKKVSDNDWIQSLCADVKISAAGASKATKNQKAKNKAKSKKK